MNSSLQTQRAALALYDTLADLDSAQRTARLEQAGVDREVATVVKAWLSAEGGAGPATSPTRINTADLSNPEMSPTRINTVGLSNADLQAQPGERFGPFSLLRELGQGGMGSVWLATRADGDFTQQVALKLIRPDRAAGDAQARFRRERRILATLKHPNIAQLLDGGISADGRLWLAMEWVEGRSLREILARGPLERRRLLALASELSAALAHAHAANVVHRDLKPENIMFGREGYAKVLDFGIAKLLADESAPRTDSETQRGDVIGTPPYMSPEQATGAPIDFRSDQFSLGAVLFEATTGRSAFARPTPAATVAAVLQEAPEFAIKQITALPQSFVRVLRRCLAKDPQDRYGSTADLARDFAELEPDAALPTRRLTGKPMLLLALLALLTVALASTSAWLLGRSTGSPPPALSVRAELAIAPAERLWFDGFPQHAFALSPDGRRVVFSAWQGATRSLFLRTLDEHSAVALAGTANAVNPVFSPDGEWILFFGGGYELRKVPARGGSAVQIAQTPNHLGGAVWRSTDEIVYSPNPSTGLWRVSAAGGEPVQLTFPDFDAGEASHVWPAVVPGSKLILYVAEIEAEDSFDAARIYAFDPDSGKRTLLVDGGSDPSVQNGILYYANAGVIYAVGFDSTRPGLRGTPQPLYKGVVYSPSTGAAQFAVSGDTSVRLHGGQGGDLIDPVIVDRAGKVESVGLPPRMYEAFQLSPDGRRAAFQIAASDHDIWVYEFDRRALTRITDRNENIFPTWTPDGKYIIYSHYRGPPPVLYRRRADGSGEPEVLTQSSGVRAQLAEAVTPDGRFVLYNQYIDSDDIDIDMYDFETKTTASWLKTTKREYAPRVSPDGRWVAYGSDGSGRSEIYVQAFSGDTRRYQISTQGGDFPRWRADGRELFFMRGGTVYGVALKPGNDLAPGIPQAVLSGEFYGQFDVFPDGNRFLMGRNIREPAGAGPLLIDIGPAPPITAPAQ